MMHSHTKIRWKGVLSHSAVGADKAYSDGVVPAPQCWNGPRCRHGGIVEDHTVLVPYFDYIHRPGRIEHGSRSRPVKDKCSVAR